MAYSTRQDGGGSRAAKLRPPPCHRLRCPAPPPGNPTARWAARSGAAPVSAPPDGDNGAPRWGRLCPASGGVDHWPRSRPPWLSTTGIAQGGGEGGATLGGGGGGKGSSRPGVGRHCDAVPPRVLVAVRQLLWRRQGRYIRNNGQQISNNQKLTKGGFQ
jgi:hypothetical protein